MNKEIFISAEALSENLSNPDLVIFDTSWHLPTSGRNGYEDYKSAHIEGALYFDIDELSDKTSPYPHMLAPAQDFAKKMGEMGISDQHQIIVYDQSPLFSSARARWMLKLYGAKSVRILEGGLKTWQDAGFPLSDQPAKLRNPTLFYSSFNPSLVIDYEALLKTIAQNKAMILDARSSPRFNGKAPEPRDGLSSGHMPNAKNLPFTMLIDEQGKMKDENTLKTIFSTFDIQAETPIITSCGSGVTAAVISLALEIIGHKQNKLYDGSWSEYAAKEGSIIIKD